MMMRLEHGFSLALPPSRALPLFTPRGEEAWVPGWVPRCIDPPDGAPQVGMVWSTAADSVWWTCLRWDLDAGRAGYLRLTPGVKVARVWIRATPGPLPDTSEIAVAYEWIALNAQGGAEIAAVTPKAFADEIDGWRALIVGAGLAPA